MNNRIEVIESEHENEILYELDYESARSGDEYVDTYRATPIQDKYPTKSESENHYAKRSCCGYTDWVYKTRSGHYYLIGYNYGH